MRARHRDPSVATERRRAFGRLPTAPSPPTPDRLRRGGRSKDLINGVQPPPPDGSQDGISPRLVEPSGGRRRTSGEPAEGPPQGRGDDGDEAGAGVPAGAKRREARRAWRARAARRPPKEPSGRLRSGTVRPRCCSPQGGGTAAWRSDFRRSRRGRPTAVPQEPRGHQDGHDARRGRWGKAPPGAARWVGAGGRRTTPLGRADPFDYGNRGTGRWGASMARRRFT